MRAAVFSGTSEGKEIAEYLNSRHVDTLVCVATEYGSEVMPPMEYVKVHTGRLDTIGIAQLIQGFDLVIDATHPFAQLVTKNILSACEIAGVRYIRLLRDEIKRDDVIYAADIKEAAEHLKNTQGNIFVSTGSKELEQYTVIKNYRDRLTVRALPVSEAAEKCSALGIKKTIFLKGPFSFEQNYEQFKTGNIKWLVTKSSGTNGGFEEKIKAAKALNINVIVIKRPQENGLDIAKAKALIDEVIKCPQKL